LIFFFIGGFTQQKPAACGIECYTGIMACYEKIKIKLMRFQERQVKLYMAVTFNAGVGSVSRLVDFDETADHLFVKNIGEIKHMVVYTKAERYIFSVVYVAQGTTAAFTPAQLERYAGALKTLPEREGGGDRTVYAARHGYNGFFQ
jgi:hypothetical protein